MMKDDVKRVIEYLERSKGNYADWLHSHVWSNADGFYHIVQTTIVALQEQLDRLEGCPICLRIRQTVYRDKNNVDSKQVYIKDNFCYNCGRKLRGGEDDKR